MRRQADGEHGLLKGPPDIFGWAPTRVNRRRIVHRLAQGAPLLIVAAACLFAAGTLTSCTTDPVVVPPPPTGPPASIIRVLLTAAPVAEATVATSGGYQLLAGGKLLTKSYDPLGKTNVSRRGGVWRFAGLTTRGRRLQLKAVGKSTINLAATSYSGQMYFLPRGPDKFIVVNHVPMNDYLAGVLPKELIPSWHIQTYRAQAIAARTFATYHKVTFGRTHDYDVGDSTSWQVYGGATARTGKSVQAVQSTRRQILLAGPDGREKIFMAQYSACNGGYVNGANVIRDARPLAALAGGQIDPDGRRCRRFRWATVSIAKTDIYRALTVSYQKAAALKRVEQIRVVSRTPYGRAVWIDVIGEPGAPPLRIRAEDLRLSLLRSKSTIPAARNLHSMNCKIINLPDHIEFQDGRGFGHGVGLSQWGAQDKAQRGWPAEKILQFYYPTAKIFRLNPRPAPPADT